MSVTATLTTAERQAGIAVSAGLAVLGFAMAAAAKTGPMALHGVLALVLGLALVVSG
jgi:cytochrome c oxidase cbb3-type subunit 1